MILTTEAGACAQSSPHRYGGRRRPGCQRADKTLIFKILLCQYSTPLGNNVCIMAIVHIYLWILKFNDSYKNS